MERGQQLGAVDWVELDEKPLCGWSWSPTEPRHLVLLLVFTWVSWDMVNYGGAGGLQEGRIDSMQNEEDQFQYVSE